MQEEIREIDIDYDTLIACDVTRLISLFFKQMTITNAKILAGSIVLVFPKFDNDTRPICIIPEIRAFIKKLQSEEGRFPFYYLDEAAIGAHLTHLACLSPLEKIVLTEDGANFQLRIDNSDIIIQYLKGIVWYMQQLEYEQQEIDARIKSITLGLGIR